MTPAEHMAAWARRNKERWVGLTCPIVTVTEEVDVEKLLRDAPKPIMVHRLTISNIDQHLEPQTS